MGNLCKMNAVIVSPSYSDNPKKFTAGLSTSIKMIAKIHNVENLNHIRIQIKYPDQKYQWIIPKASDFRQQSPLHHRLITDILISHGPWTEACNIEVSIVYCYDPDADINNSIVDVSSRMEASSDTVLELCNPVKVFMLPKLPRK